MNNKLLGLVLGSMLLTLLALIMVVSREPREAVGSVRVGDGYKALTFGNGGLYTSATTHVATTTCQEILGAISFAAPTTGIVELIDATTTNINLRTGNLATSSVLIKHYPAGMGTSTDHLDVALKVGLSVVYKGTISSSTVTCR